VSSMSAQAMSHIPTHLPFMAESTLKKKFTSYRF
jgi:hypothetical protein